MIKKFLIICLLFLSACSAQDKAIDPDRIVTRKEVKLAVGEVTQTLNVSPLELIELIQDVFAYRKISLAKVDSGLGKLVSTSIPVSDRVCSVVSTSSIPLNCEVVVKISVEPYRSNASKMLVSYREDCDGIESKDLKCPDSNAEKLMLSIVSDIKKSAGLDN